jgi:flavin-dependent dehydrogenase
VNDCDVIVLGGGFAGLSAALQLKQERPATSVVVVEKREHPVPEAAFKVGESSAEIGSHYLRDTIGMESHMEHDQLRKFSLRLFSPANGNTDVARRPEIGLHKISPLRTYQIDRGRLENALAAAVADAGVELLDGHAVSSFELGPERHSVTVRRNGSSREVSARWIVDASGRTGLLRRQLRLGVEIPHDVNASWFRVAERVTIDDWSDDPAWRARVPSGRRWASTVQLVGEGYWVWLIPLASGGTSVGLVADPRFIPFERIRRYPDLLDWMRENEPELASKLPSDEAGLQDFRKLKNYAYGTRRGLSLNRWALTGEAGLFLDPLYSTGFDFIAVANTLATRLIAEALDGDPRVDLRRRLRAFNGYYLGQFLGWEPAFAGQYEVFRDAQATAAKIVWDNASYLMFPVLLFTKGCITDPEFVASVREPMVRIHFLNIYMQRCLRELSAYDCDIRDAGFPIGSDYIMEDVFDMVVNPMPSKAAVAARLEVNAARLEAIGRQLVARMYEACGRRAPEPPHDAPSDTGEELLWWTPYEHRNVPPAEAPRQPDSWMLR